ncbi:hypothetical protein [Guptibacillus spartinae]|uniref:hypothetical protein n=1 Tax=Guptibacillus spartinae TaxID=3025679 RepID=UPI00235E0D6F|nr:hypothetical protein [Pseudalkalibacillus spartinae]
MQEKQKKGKKKGMSSTGKMVAWIVGGVVLFLLILTGIIIWIVMTYFSGFFADPEDELNKYMKKKYGEEITLVYAGNRNEANLGDTEHKVALKDNPDFDFWIDVNGFFRTIVEGDDYEKGKKTYEKYQTIEDDMLDISEFGFTRIQVGQYSTYLDYTEEGFYRLNVQDDHLLSRYGLKEEELKDMMELIEWIRSKGVDIGQLMVFGRPDEAKEGYQIELLIKDVQLISSIADLKKEIAEEHPSTLSHEIEEQMIPKMKTLEEERIIPNVSDQDTHEAHWISCNAIDQDGKCSNMLLALYYETDGFYPGHPYVIQDLTKVFEWIKPELGQDGSVTIQVIEKGVQQEPLLNLIELDKSDESEMVGIALENDQKEFQELKMEQEQGEGEE